MIVCFCFLICFIYAFILLDCTHMPLVWCTRREILKLNWNCIVANDCVGDRRVHVTGKFLDFWVFLGFLGLFFHHFLGYNNFLSVLFFNNSLKICLPYTFGPRKLKSQSERIDMHSLAQTIFALHFWQVPHLRPKRCQCQIQLWWIFLFARSNF